MVGAGVAAAVLAGASPVFLNASAASGFKPNYRALSDDTWRNVQLVYACSPGNPGGAVMNLDDWRLLFELSDRHGFVVASDECYSELYYAEDSPPLGALQAANMLGRSEYPRLVMFSSLSKRSNAPGMRSGFVAGDAALLKNFLLYRTYHGSAMSTVVQAASIAAWDDEDHVRDNRAQYRAKFAQVTPLLAGVLDVALPDAGFYLWAKVDGSDTDFARDLLALYNVTVLPGSYLARDAQGINPGASRIRMALVAETAECVEAAHRIVQFVQSRR